MRFFTTLAASVFYASFAVAHDEENVITHWRVADLSDGYIQLIMAGTIEQEEYSTKLRCVLFDKDGLPLDISNTEPGDLATETELNTKGLYGVDDVARVDCMYNPKN